MSKLFEVHILNAKGKMEANAIAKAFEDLLTTLTIICGDGTREFAITKTKLEEAAFYAKKAMANNPDNQEVA